MFLKTKGEFDVVVGDMGLTREVDVASNYYDSSYGFRPIMAPEVRVIILSSLLLLLLLLLLLVVVVVVVVVVVLVFSWLFIMAIRVAHSLW